MQTKTSFTHPLKIDAIPCGGGMLGMTLCPGKQVNSNFGGRWERDLALDIGAIVDWGASTLVSLMEEHEFSRFEVPNLGDVAESVGLEWHCIPIRDEHAPDERFERLWTYSGHVLRGKLAAGERIVVHCRGGLGRTGTIAARLLIESGVAPEEALRRVREARPWTVEPRQEPYVLQQQALSCNDRDYASRVLGCLLGGAVGDALGYEVEFSSLRAIRDRFGQAGIQEPVLSPDGKAVVSDDTQMTIFTADGLIESLADNGSINQNDALDAIRAATFNWYSIQKGRGGVGRLADYSVLAKSRAPGTTCMGACSSGATGTPENPINNSKGCGGLMRVAPVGLCLALSGEEAFELAARCAAQTHGHPCGYLSAGTLAAIMRNLLSGLGLDRCVARSVEIASNWPSADQTIDAVERARELSRQQIDDHANAIAQRGEGWFGDEALAIGLYSALVATDFEDAVRIAANHSGDSDSTASIAGQIHGAWKGLAGVPHAWVRRLDALDPLLDVAGRIIAARNQDAPVRLLASTQVGRRSIRPPS